MKVKIAYIVSTLRQAGPTNQLYGILKYLDLNKFDPVIISLSPEPDNSMIDKFRKLQIPIISLNLSRIKGFIIGLSLLKKRLSEINPDIIHSQGIRPNMMSRKLKGKYPHVLSLRNYPFEDYPGKLGKVMGTFIAKTHYKIIKQEKYSIVCSRSLSEIYLVNHQLNLAYIQNGVNTENFYPLSEEDKKLLRQKLGIPTDKKVFISVGSLVPLKYTDLTIKAFLNSANVKNSLLIVVGDGVEKQKLETLANNSSSIRFLGNIQNVKKYLQTSDVYISASSSEGLPNTVLEAMACKLPVVLTNILPHIELVGHEYPYLSNVNDVEQLTKNMESIIDADLDKIGTEMLQRVKSNFTAEIMSEKYQELYLKIVNE